MSWNPMKPGIRLHIFPDAMEEMGIIDWPDKMELELTGHRPNKSFNLPHVHIHMESDETMTNQEIHNLIDFERAFRDKFDQLNKIGVAIAHVQIEHWEFNMCRNIKMEIHNKPVERPLGQEIVKMSLPAGWEADIDFYFESYNASTRKNPAVRIMPYKRFEIGDGSSGFLK